MLRHYVGEEAFYTTLNRYLHRHAYQSVEVHDLRLAFEETTGEDLSWFFNQWYLKPGHPNLSYSHNYDATSKTVSLQISQTQEKAFPQVFAFL
jgi:aminopeptidase N